MRIAAYANDTANYARVSPSTPRARPEGELRSAPHARGTVEHLTVTRGELRVESGSTSRIVASGETARYRADVAHAIVNYGREAAAAFLVVTTRL